jgi:hypothetical protein
LLLVLYARLASAKFGNNFWFNLIAGALVYTAVVPSYKFILGKIISHEILRLPECVQLSSDEVRRRYAPDMIGRQIAYKLNNLLISSAARENPPRLPTLYQFQAHALMWRWTIDFDPAPNVPKFVRQMDEASQKDYCSDTFYWKVARSLNIPLLVGIKRRTENNWMLAKRYDPSMCTMK